MRNRPLSPQDLAARWGIPTEALALWRHHGKGPCFIHVGRLIRYPVAEVEAFERRMKNERSWTKRIPVTAFMEMPSKKIGRLRRSKFSEKKSQFIIRNYLTYLSDRQPTCYQQKVIDDFRTLMTLSITSRDSDEIEIGDDTDQLTPEVLFVDLINNLEKTSALVNAVLDQACGKLRHLNRTELLRAVDNFGDMITRRRVNALLCNNFKSGLGN
ncbi:hypothetical protein [Limnohabitans sp.]